MTATQHAGPRIGILGGGFMGQVHSRAARRAGADIVGVVASTPERSRAVAEELGAADGYADLEALLAAGVDVVHVCTPNALHADQASAVLDAGAHVICEKPLATTVEDAERVTAQAEDSGRTATVPFVYRYHPMVREARARIRAGDLGTLLTVQGRYLQDWMLTTDDDNWRVNPAEGGRSRAFADIGSHLVDLLEFVTGDRVQQVAASRRTFFADRADHRDIQTEDALALTLTLESGAIGSLLVSQLAAGRKNDLRLEVHGSQEAYEFAQESPDTLWIGRRSGSVQLPRDPELMHPDAARLCHTPAGHPQGYQDAFDNFVADTYAAMAGEEPEGLPRFADGLRAARLTDAVMDATESSSWKEIS